MVKKIVFADHVAYGPGVLERISAATTGSEAEVLVTTAKDRIKINATASLPLPLWTLEVEIRIMDGEDVLVRAILQTSAP